MYENYVDWLPMVLKIAQEAATEIMKFYRNNPLQPFEIKIKQDASPVTSADICAHQIILQGLSVLTPTIPVLSEEGSAISFKERATWTRYWLVDPLDGTREFLTRTGEFAVNIALIEEHCPVLGVVVVPWRQEAYWAVSTHRAYYQQGNNNLKTIHVSTRLKSPIRIAVSRRHTHYLKLQEFLEHLKHWYEKPVDFKFISCGSALKICLVASGVADIYPRLGVTGEWDTAAGQCILEAAGGILCDLKGKPLRYNIKPSLFHRGFLAIGANKLHNFACG